MDADGGNEKNKKKINWEMIFIFILFLISMTASYVVVQNQNADRELDYIRCQNGTYDPCNLRCRKFWDVIRGTDDCK